MLSLADTLPRVLPLSRYLAQLLTATPALNADLAAGWDRMLTAETLRGFLPASIGEDTLKPVLRHLKQRAYVRIVTRDLAGLASLAEVTESMTLIAEIAVETALVTLTPALAARHGVPRNKKGEEQRLLVIGMGKLGGRELNVSSDIDLIFVYPEDGETDAVGENARPLSNFDFFTRLGRNLINAIAEVTSDGQVFRVDMRLRPNGDSGPLVCSFDMLEHYFIAQGREWERYAWIKARPLGSSNAGGMESGAVRDYYGNHWWNWCATLESIRRPFVFRKYLDFGAIDAMRGLHTQIRREVARKDMAGNVKLGPGGIREIEFIAQVFQLIRGGRDTQLQIKPTLQALALLAERNQITLDTALELAAAYEFLRRLEHRLQYLNDAQTHSLPEQPEDQAIIAEAMGFASFDALLVELDDHRAAVAGHFEAVFADPNRATRPRRPLASCDGDALVAELSRHGYQMSPRVGQLAAISASRRYQQMPERCASVSMPWCRASSRSARQRRIPIKPWRAASTCSKPSAAVPLIWRCC